MMFLTDEPGTAGHARARRLSSDECTKWLACHHEGRLEYVGGRGRRAVVVRYVLSGDQVEFRLPDYNDIVHYAPGEQVTLVVEGTLTPEGGQETVGVIGTAQLAGSGTPSVDEEAQLDETWASGVATRVICLRITNLSGVVQPI